MKIPKHLTHSDTMTNYITGTQAHAGDVYGPMYQEIYDFRAAVHNRAATTVSQSSLTWSS